MTKSGDLQMKDIGCFEELTLDQFHKVMRFIKEFNKVGISIHDFAHLSNLYEDMRSSEERSTIFRYIEYTKEPTVQTIIDDLNRM
jgi:hypothetical protein